MKNMLPKNLEAIFLDFDGIVVESTNIKTEAFYEVYLPYGKDIASKAKQYHLAYQGIARSIKFGEIHKLFLNKECDSGEQARLSAAFSGIILEKILECPLVDGIIEFLEENLTKNIPVFLLSATPHEELKLICDRRGLSRFFKIMQGSPCTKKNAGENILKKYNLYARQAIFVGDSISDYEAASALGIPFMGRVGKGMINPFPHFLPIISSFKNITL